MTRAARHWRFLRWHWARLRDGACRFVCVPGLRENALVFIRREGDALYVDPGMLRTPVRLRMAPRQLQRRA